MSNRSTRSTYRIEAYLFSNESHSHLTDLFILFKNLLFPRTNDCLLNHLVQLPVHPQSLQLCRSLCFQRVNDNVRDEWSSFLIIPTVESKSLSENRLQNEGSREDSRCECLIRRRVSSQCTFRERLEPICSQQLSPTSSPESRTQTIISASAVDLNNLATHVHNE